MDGASAPERCRYPIPPSGLRWDPMARLCAYRTVSSEERKTPNSINFYRLQMGSCAFGACAGDDSLSGSCTYCGDSFCAAPRLPENHDCVGLARSDSLGPEFREWKRSETSSRKTKRRTREAERVRSKCERCSDYTTPERDLCFECRRREATMSSRSPDVDTDGSLTSLEDPGEVPRENGSRSRVRDVLSRIRSLF